MDKKVSRTTSWRIKKGMSPGIGKVYHERKCIPAESFNFQDAKKIASLVFFRDWYCKLPNHIGSDDVIQECIIRMWELSGRAKKRAYFFKVSSGVIRTILKKERNRELLIKQ